MEKGLIGIQMSTIKKKVDELGAYETLKACAEMGYHCMEVSQIPMTAENVAGFRRAIDELGMNVSSCTAAVAPMAPGMPGEFLSVPEDFKKIVADCKALDCDLTDLLVYHPDEDTPVKSRSGAPLHEQPPKE